MASDELSVIEIDQVVYRVARGDAWAWPDWRYAGPDGRFRTRFADPLGEYRTLYASSTRLGAFVETLAPLRPSLTDSPRIEAIGSDEPDTHAAGVVVARYSNSRVMGSARLVGRFADLTDADSLAFLRQRLTGGGSGGIARLRETTDLMLTQAISRVVFELGGHREPRIDGLRYLSRYDDSLEHWAVFEPFEFVDRAEGGFLYDDPDLLVASRGLGIVLG